MDSSQGTLCAEGVARHKKLTAVSLFCGVGGLDYGFYRAGVEVLGAYDIDHDAISTYERFFGHRPTLRDVRTLRASEVAGAHIVIAGPPCQGFSSIAARIPRDPRNSLILRSAALIAECRPQAFLIENVTGIQWHSKGHYLRQTFRALRSAGLLAKEFQIDCSRFGVPQRRKRILVVGAQRQFAEKVFERVQVAVETREQVVTVGEKLLTLPRLGSLLNHTYELAFPTWYEKVIPAIGPGQKLCDTRLGPTAIHSWDLPTVFGRTSSNERRLLQTLASVRRWTSSRRYHHIGDGKPVRIDQLSCLLEWPLRQVQAVSNQLLKKGYLAKCRVGYVDLARKFNGRFKRLPIDGVAPAVLQNFSSPRNILHPVENRGLTVRECARLQGFPDTFEFLGTVARQYQLVANAFPPLVSDRIARAIVDGLRSH